MSDSIPLASEVQQLKEPLSEDHVRALQLLVHACLDEGGQWPMFNWLEAELDGAGLDAIAVLSSFPQMRINPPLVYSAVSAVGGFSPVTEVGVTALGVWQLGQSDRAYAALANDFEWTFYLLLGRIAASRREFRPPKRDQNAPSCEVSRSQVQEWINSVSAPTRDPRTDLLVEAVLRAERPPGMALYASGEEWGLTVGRQSLLYDQVRTIDDYLRRLATLAPPLPSRSAPVLPSPLDLVTAMDYLNVVWRLAYGEDAGPFQFHSAERIARLSHPVATNEEFAAAMSAVGDVIKNLAVRNESGSHPCDRLEERLKKLPSGLPARALDAVSVLRSVMNVRHTTVHSTVPNSVIVAWKDLGISYPTSDWPNAWNTVRGHLVEAINAIREELSVLTGGLVSIGRERPSTGPG